MRKGEFMRPCEVCEKPAVGNCSGLDVPELWFCEEHLAEHEQTCPDVLEGKAMINRPESTVAER